MIGGGIGYWRGELGYSLGISKQTDDGRVIIKIGGTGNSRGRVGASAGVGIQF